MTGQLLALTLSLALAALLTSCFKEDLEITTARGSVTNKYTNQPLSGVPVVVRRFYGGSWYGGGGFTDSVTAARTDAAGNYSVSFKGPRRGSYELQVEDEDLFDVVAGYDGHYEASYGVGNEINFEVTPFKTVTVNATSSKNGGTDINFSFTAWDQGPWFGNNIFQDTVKSNQVVQFSRRIRLVPNRQYRFFKTTSTRFQAPNTFYFQYRNQVTTHTDRFVGYNDTTVITLN